MDPYSASMLDLDFEFEVVSGLNMMEPAADDGMDLADIEAQLDAAWPKDDVISIAQEDLDALEEEGFDFADTTTARVVAALQEETRNLRKAANDADKLLNFKADYDHFTFDEEQKKIQRADTGETVDTAQALEEEAMRLREALGVADVILEEVHPPPSVFHPASGVAPFRPNAAPTLSPETSDFFTPAVNHPEFSTSGCPDPQEWLQTDTPVPQLFISQEGDSPALRHRDSPSAETPAVASRSASEPSASSTLRSGGEGGSDSLQETMRLLRNPPVPIESPVAGYISTPPNTQVLHPGHQMTPPAGKLQPVSTTSSRSPTPFNLSTNNSSFANNVTQDGNGAAIHTGLKRVHETQDALLRLVQEQKSMMELQQVEMSRLREEVTTVRTEMDAMRREGSTGRTGIVGLDAHSLAFPFAGRDPSLRIANDNVVSGIRHSFTAGSPTRHEHYRTALTRFYQSVYDVEQTSIPGNSISAAAGAGGVQQQQARRLLGEKLAQLDSVLLQFRGYEEDLFKLLRAKYDCPHYHFEHY